MGCAVVFRLRFPGLGHPQKWFNSSEEGACCLWLRTFHSPKTCSSLPSIPCLGFVVKNVLGKHTHIGFDGPQSPAQLRMSK